jgi:hypothetical protein
MKTLKLSMEEREKGILMKVQGRKCFGKGRHAIFFTCLTRSTG